MVEETSKDSDYSAFREKLLNAKSKDKKGKEGIGDDMRFTMFNMSLRAAREPGTRLRLSHGAQMMRRNM